MTRRPTRTFFGKKWCKGCNQPRRLDKHFYSRIDKRNGQRYYQSRCKECMKKDSSKNKVRRVLRKHVLYP